MVLRKQVSIYEAKTMLSSLIQEALEGTEIIIAKSRKPLVKLVVIDREQDNAIKAFGKYDKKKAKIPKNFDAPIKDLEDYS